MLQQTRPELPKKRKRVVFASTPGARTLSACCMHGSQHNNRCVVFALDRKMESQKKLIFNSQAAMQIRINQTCH